MGPHFVVGMPRAGTTFLVRSLNQHPRVVSFGESRFWGNDWVEPGPDGYDRAQLETVIERLAANPCLLYTSPSPRDATLSRMPSSA